LILRAFNLAMDEKINLAISEQNHYSARQNLYE